ncbi:MAG: MFS transporter [Silicimonas sp.]|nr:MFS transporter [Silicimonas sp.]
MAEPSLKKRIWGWFFFDWASQPYHTVLLTFVFGPFFAQIATDLYLSNGLEEQAARAQAQTTWSFCLTVAGLIVGFGGPVMNALADTTGRRMPWIVFFAALYIVGASALWGTNPDGSNLTFGLMAFALGFIGAEFALIFINAQLPGLGSKAEIGRISGSGFAFGYLGGFIALIFVLAFLVEQPSGKTLVEVDPIFGLDASTREGTRAVGPFVAIWFALFMVPYFLWVREVRERRGPASFVIAFQRLTTSIGSVMRRPSMASFLGGSMLYRDALNGLYGFGGTYAYLVLEWEVAEVGAFGIVTILAGVVLSWLGGRLDGHIGPKPVIVGAALGLMVTCALLAGMSRTSFFGAPLAETSTLPDTTFMICGIAIGGLGGILQAASRSLMVRHADLAAPTESFALYGLSGRATSFLAPALIGVVTAATGNARFGVLPLIVLFLLGLLLLRWTHPEGDRAEPWSETSSTPY